MTEYLFSYGTLQKDEVQVELFGRCLEGSRDLLPGYKLATVEITDPSFLSRGEQKMQQTLVATGNSADTITGMVFCVSTEELSQADRYEPGNYKRIKVKMASGRAAWVYMIVE